MQSAEHSSHDLIEKYDYLQSSRHLVDLKFRDMNNLLGGLKFENKNEMEDLKNKIRKNYFPSLFELLKKIEYKLNDIVDFYNDNVNENVNNAKNNFNLVKEFCSVGLDKLKDELEMDKMMIKENVFLTFDKKYKDLDLEKNRLVSDLKKVENIQYSFGGITNAADRVYNDIKSYLEGVLNSTIYSKNKITTVEKVSKDEIISNILSNLPDKKSRSSVLNKTLDHSFISRREEERDKENRIGRNTLEISPIKQVFDNMSKRSQKELFIKGAKVLRIVPKTRDISIYDDITSEVTTKSITFPLLAGIDKFLENCAYVNYDEKIYISGGLTNNQSSNSFLCYDHERNNFVRMADLITPRHSHSMIYWNDSIFVVGGNTSAVEKYDFKTQKWIKLMSLPYEDIFRPILYVYNNYLYCFFGQKKDNYVDYIQRMNLKNNKSKWEVVPYKNNEKIDLKVIGCGIIPNTDNTILFLGGKGKDGLRRDAFNFDLLTNSFQKSTILLEKESYFNESIMVELDKGIYGHFDTECGEHFLRLLNN
jgi:hypothetical protein